MGIQIFSPKWWLSTLVQVFIIMVFIYIIKGLSEKFNIPIVKTVAEAI
jgi:uncharacterized membrane protein